MTTDVARDQALEMKIAALSSRNDAKLKKKVWTQAEAAANESSTATYFHKERESQGLGKAKTIRLEIE